MLRVRVEVVPHGREDAALVVDEVWAGNDGTGISGGANEGGVGNYDFWHPPVGTDAWETSIGEVVGRFEGLKRTPEHRLLLAKLALEAAIKHQAAKDVLAQDA